jgi:hypothetical protein
MNRYKQEVFVENGDMIDKLPTDKSIPTHEEIELVDKVFEKQKGAIDKIFFHIKDLIVLALLYIVFSLPFVDNIIKSCITSAGNSYYILVGIKTLLFVSIYYLIKNLYMNCK